MEDNTLRVHGNPNPKGLSWLKEVKVDAARNTIEHLRRQADQREFEQAKARGISPQEIISKGKEDLAKADSGYAEEFYTEEETQTESQAESSEEIDDLKRQLKAAKAAQTRAENKLKAQEKPEEDPKGPEEVVKTETKEEETK